jgi:N-acetylmuramoyl-L-alanine amidase
MRDIIVVAGHTNVKNLDQGASGNGFIEGQLTVELRDLILSELKILGVKAKTDANNNALAQTLQWLKFNLFSSKTICLDVHWNAGVAAAKGSEVIVPDVTSQFEKDLAKDLLKVLVDVGFKDRGVKPEALTARKKLGWMRPVAENVLIEICFITNSTDMKLYQANKQIIAKKLALVLSTYSKKP